MVDLRSPFALRPSDGHDIEPYRTMRQAVLIYIKLGQTPQLILLGIIDSSHGTAGAVAAACFDFDNDDRLAVRRHQVEIAARYRDTATDNAIALAAQIPSGGFFAALAQRLSAPPEPPRE